MFTGLIEELGTIAAIQNGAKSSILTIKAHEVLKDIKLGDSIATNGVCLTVTSFSSTSFSVDVMPETLRRSNLGQLKVGSIVNLERALRLGDRLGGHMVSGHIDGLGTITHLEKDDNAIWYTLSAAPSILKYIIEKGSVALDGISLTVAAVDHHTFRVSIIPHTLAMTSLKSKHVGDAINIECDAFGKYVERITQFNEPAKKQTLDLAFLKEHGF